MRNPGIAEISECPHVVRSKSGGNWLSARWRWLMAWSSILLKNFHSRPARRLRVSETLSVGEKRQLLLVECGNRQLLIGAATNGLTVLAELHLPEDEKQGERHE